MFPKDPHGLKSSCLDLVSQGSGILSCWNILFPKILDFPIIQGVKAPHFKFRPEKPINDFLTELSLAGSSHHFAIAYGRLTSKIKKIAYLIDTQFINI